MNLNKYVLNVTLAISLCAGSTLDAFATEGQDGCKSVVAVGDPQWAPYVVRGSDNELTGVGMELVELIFSELDIPVIKSSYDDEREMLHNLSIGNIDILVSAYENERLAKAAEIISPNYTDDPVVVAVNRKVAPQLIHWDDLIGQKGLMGMFFQAEDPISVDLERYLSINRTDDSISMLSALRDNDINYVIGSNLQLKYLIKEFDMQKPIKIAEELSRSSGVHMAYSCRSSCSEYATYFKNRLEDLIRNRTVDQFISKYIPK